MNRRIIFGILLTFLTLYTPFWLYVPGLLFGIIVFPLYVESVVLSLFVDYFYGPHMYVSSLFGFPFAIVSGLLILALIPIKERFRFIQ